MAVMTMAGGWCPTVDIDVRFLKPGKIGDKIIGVGRFVSAGKRVFHMESKLYNKETGEVIATSTSTFLNILNK
jgi:acyl-coenzyme A thioesterase PaaI-like protein